MTTEEQMILAKSQKLSHWSAQKMYYHVKKKNQRNWTVRRGEVYFVDLGESVKVFL